jgi:Flp pilus assembly protein TadG
LLSRFRSDSGSAALEFVLILVPASLLAVPLVSMMSLMHSSVVTQQIAYDVARYGALADTTTSMKSKYLNARDKTMILSRSTGKSPCLTQIKVTKNYFVGFMDLSVDLESRAMVQCEID